MKYGQTLQQRSIPAWSHHNIDYNDIKQVIKEQTTPGKGKTISVPGRGDDKLVQLEDSLFSILAEQHHRIDLFVRSKSGEIKRRLNHSQKQLKQLSARISVTADQRIPVGRLERYGRLENDVLKAGEEIKSLARFTSIQRTAFRKLLKKYKKWTGSTQLEDRFRTEILDDPKGFTNVDLGPLLDDYSTTLHDVRTLYESRIRQNASSAPNATFTTTSSSSSVAQLQSALNSGSRAEFDTAVATIPLGENGQLASYFVHPESVIELQMLLLQHCRYFSTRSRANSVATPVSPSPRRRDSSYNVSKSADFFSLGADSPDRFEREQNTLTVNEREHVPGISPQKVRICARWNNDEDVQISSRTVNGTIRNGTIKQKQIDTFFDKTADLSKRANSGTDNDETTQACRRDLEHQNGVRPLYKISSCRSRFVGPMGNSEGAVFATLDTGISFEGVDIHAASGDKSDFPYAVLQVRQEDPKAGTLLSTLDASHLVERVRGFSFEAHAIWTTCTLSNQSPPIWLPILSRDIRKLPPSAPQRPASHSQGGSGAQSATAGSSSTYTDQGVTDGTISFESPPIRSFRKKRRRPYPETNQEQRSQRYWSEYDHPEDMSDGGNGGEDAYVIYIDPNQKSVFEGMLDRISEFFGRPGSRSDEEAYMTPGSPRDDETSSDEEETTGLMSNRTKPRTSYGAIPGTHGATAVYSPYHDQEETVSPNPISATSFVASVAILVTAYFLVLTSKRKLRYEVDAGVIFAMVSSLFFALFGFVALFRQPGKVSLLGWTAAGTVLALDIVGTAGLLAWMLA